MTALAPVATGPIETADQEHDWSAYLRKRLSADWRPGEYDHERLHFIPDPLNSRTSAHVCKKADCNLIVQRPGLCTACALEWSAVRASDEISEAEWLTIPRVRVVGTRSGCVVPGCERNHFTHGLCADHRGHYRWWAKQHTDQDNSIDAWVVEARPSPLGFREKCGVPTCVQSRGRRSPLCVEHDRRYRRESSTAPDLAESIEQWLGRSFEPAVFPDNPATTYAAVIGTPFYVLPEPLRWELVYALQQRDLLGMSSIYPDELRKTYQDLRRRGVRSVVGLQSLGMTGNARATFRSLLHELQRHVDDAHRDWSGADDRDPRIIYLRDLELRHSTRGDYSPRARLDLRSLTQEWLVETFSSWARAMPRGRQDLYQTLAAVAVADGILQARGTPRHLLGLSDMDAIITAVRKRWDKQHTQSARIGAIARLVQFARIDQSTADVWQPIPAAFAVNTVRHRAVGAPDASSAWRSDAENYRYVPQPVIDWVMDHLVAYERHDEYSTAEVRVMIFLQERLGRRTVETTRLKDDCISYDDEGAPYVEWTHGKPPWNRGKRIPIHSETRDVIEDWRALKRKYGIKSEWLFPSTGRRHIDRPYPSTRLSKLVADYVTWIAEKYPYTGLAEGPEGGRIEFDIATIDAYSFRHAFAQRLADATDENGQSTTQPDVLRELMGHKSFNTTMVYYSVSAKRRKKAIGALPSRRLNHLGAVVSLAPERQGFTKIAVSLGNCTEPQNVLSGGHSCALDHACESCPFFLVDPLERDGLHARMQHLKVKLERSRAIAAPGHILEHYIGRIADCQRIIDGIDAYIASMDTPERQAIEQALAEMADVRRRANAPRTIDIRAILETSGT